MSIERVTPEHIKVTSPDTALRITQSGTGNSFIVEDVESDSTAFVIDNDGKVGVGKTPVYRVDINGELQVNNISVGYETTATSAGTKTLTSASPRLQFFTGSSSHTLVMPVASTLTTGHQYEVFNNSTGAITVNSSGGNLIMTLPPKTTAVYTCILASGTTAASWDADYVEGSAYATTATAGGTTTLSVSSAQRQFFTGTANQTVVLPVVSTITLGTFYVIHNNSTGVVTVNSSGGNLVKTMAPASTITVTSIATTGTDATVWDVDTYETEAYTTTANAGGTTTLTVASTRHQFFTGSTGQTVTLPVASTMTLGQQFVLHNNSTGNVTVNSSGANLVVTVVPGTSVLITCILTSGTTATSWDVEYTGFSATTGSGNVVRQVSPSFSVATGTSPFTVTSTTKVANLNADYLDDQDGSYYLNTSAGAQTKIGSLTIQGDLTVQGTSTFISTESFAISDNFVYLNTPAPATISNAVGNGTSVTYTTTGAHGFANGSVVQVTGISPSGYNTVGYVTITGVASNTFTVASTFTDTYTSGGEAFNRYNADPDVGMVAQRNNGGSYISAGVFLDTTDDTWKFFDGYTPDITGTTIDIAQPSFTLAPIQVGGGSKVTANSASVALTIAQSGAGGGLTVTGGQVIVPSGMKIGNTTVNQGGSVTVTLPTAAGTLVGTGDTGTITTAMLANATSTTTGVTYAKQQYVSAQYRILGRISASAGVLEELTPDNVITTINQGTTAIAADHGGTGQTSYTIGDILYASSTTALSKLAGVATGNALISGGVGAAPSWGKIGLTTHISGTLAVGNGGTGTTTATGTAGSVVLSTSPTLTTSLTISGGALSSTLNSVLTPVTVGATTTNGDNLRTKIIRYSAGSDWTTAAWRIQRLIDVTEHGYIQFGGANSSGDVRIGINNTDVLSVNATSITFAQAFTGTTGNITSDLIFKDGANNEGRLTATGGVMYLQAGQNSTDTTAQLNIARFATGTSNIASLNVYANTSTFNGALVATTKSFDIVHPTKEGMRLRYGSLEGPENGVYVRGRARADEVIELPDYWTGLVDPDSITATATPIGSPAVVYVKDISNNSVTFGATEEVEFFYFIQAERVDVDKLVVEYAG